MKIFADIWNFLGALRFVDIVFFFAVLILMILVVTLIYFIKVNNELENVEKVSDNETMEMKIAKELKESAKENEAVINFTNYEKDQEDKAIISYDELVDKSNNYGINYEAEEVKDDLVVKKIDLENLVNKSEYMESNIEVRVISFAKEEAFLQALKQLQKELG